VLFPDWQTGLSGSQAWDGDRGSDAAWRRATYDVKAVSDDALLMFRLMVDGWFDER